MGDVKRIIYQIGRFDANIDIKLNFKIDSNKYSTELSSFALKEHFKPSAEVIIIYPVSILLNKQALEKIQNKTDIRDFYETVEKVLSNDEGIKDYLNNPREYLKTHPHSKKAYDFIVIPSIGEFFGYKFFSSIGNITLRILVDMIDRYYKEPFDEMYLDISSGHNIYTYALTEAGRLFLTIVRLQDFLKEKNMKVFITISEPISSKDQEYTLFKDFQLDAKAFFYYPINPNPQQINEYAFIEYARKISIILKGEEDRDIKRKVNEILYKAYLLYSAIKNNTPLAIYYLCKEYKEEQVDELVKRIVELLKERLDENLKYYLHKEHKEKLDEDLKSFPNLNFEDIRKLLMTLGLAKGIINVLEKYGICSRELSEGVDLEELKKCFAEEEKSIYNYFELKTNIAYLRQEINRNFEIYENKITTEWKCLGEIMNLGNTGLDPRNFLAHCGFEKALTKVRKTEDGKILIRYWDDKIEIIKSFLLEAR